MPIPVSTSNEFSMKYKNYLPIYDENSCRLFALGRNAMYAACRLLNVSAGDEVLTPAFDCDGALQPFRILGYNLNFFRSDPYTFSVDINDIKKRINSKTKLIHIVNHFGMPQPWNELLSLTAETGIPILEDNAYSLFSKFDGRHFGTFGHMAIFSLRKNLSLIDGGMLRINSPKYVLTLPQKKSPLFYSTEIYGFGSIIKDALGCRKTPSFLKSLAKKFVPAAEPPPSLYSDKEKGCPKWPLRDVIGRDFSSDYLRPMSYLARIQLSRFTQSNYSAVIDKKRQYYSSLADKLSDIKGVDILWPKLPEGIVPFCLSILVDADRDIIFETLRKKYDVMVWPTLSKLVLDKLESYPEVELLGRRLLSLNLPSNKVTLPAFSRYAEALIRDIHVLLKRLPKGSSLRLPQ